MKKRIWLGAVLVVVAAVIAAFAPVAVLFKPFKNEDLLAALGRAGARIDTTRNGGAKS